MKRKISFLLIVLALGVSIAGCGKKDKEIEDANAAESQKTVEETSVQNGDEAESDEEVIEDEAEDFSEDYTLEDIAALNDRTVEQLNVLYGNKGGIVFLGDKYGEEIVTNEEEALASLKHVKTLALLEGVELEYNRTDVSPVTGNVVYTFYQTAKGNVEGETVTAKFFNSLIKVITDSEGNLVGVSADIVPADDVEPIYEEEIITKGEAIDYIKNVIADNNRNIYEDISEYAFWDDEGTVFSVNDKGKVSPAWFIYTDANPGNLASKPYEVFVVSLSPKYSMDENDEYVGKPAILSSFYVETLDMDEYLGVYTSAFYFEGMEDAGEYTYEVKLDWVKKYYPEYDGPSKGTYTVPVMYSKAEDLYYLGDVNKKIALSNYYDFMVCDTTNSYVTNNPEDKDSWHFQLDKAVDGSTGKYFDNPNYVLSSFSVMYDVWNDFYERYGLDSVDGTGLPTMLCVYQTSSYDYPTDEADFIFNATNMGQNRDWQVMATSITLGGCLEHEVMAHEYTHGVNGQLTMSQYFNGAGAVMESYADIIGDQISMLNKYPECSDEHEWKLGGTLTEELRNMGSPYEHKMPKYLGGNYYLNPVSEVIKGNFDAGGVHSNSSILNYLAYCMVNGTEADGEATFTMDECLDMWFDTLYYTNYQTDYYDVATYLTLSAESMGVDEDKYDYLRGLLVDFGLIPDGDGESYISYIEETDYYNINLIYDDSVYNDLADVFKFGITFYDANDKFYEAGGIGEDGNLCYAVESGVTFTASEYTLGNVMTGESNSFTLDEANVLPHDVDVLFSVLEVEPGEVITTDPGFELSYAMTIDDVGFDVEVNGDDTSSLIVEGEGTIVVTIKDINASTEDYGKYTICYVVSEEE